MAQGVYPLPVLVERLFPLSPRVYEVLNKLAESNIISFLQGVGLRVGPVSLDDLCSVAFVEGRVVASRELVPVGRHDALEGLPHEDELEVAAKALVYLRNWELGERAEVTCNVRLIGGDGKWVGVAAVAGQDHEHTLPVGAGYLEDTK